MRLPAVVHATPSLRAAPATLLRASLAHARRLARAEPVLWWGAWGFVALGLLFALLLQLDPRMLGGEPLWRKPAKFAFSIAIYVVTLAALLAPLPPARPRSAIRAVTVGAMTVEMAIIAAQAARGVPSHFNDATPLDGALYAVMGIAILASTVAAVWLLVAHLRRAHFAPAVTLGVRIGLGVFLAGSVVGGAMSGLDSHDVGATEGGERLAGTGWSTEHGDLRIAHFAGLHGLQVVPLAALALRDRPRARLEVALVGAGYAVIVLALFALALAGASPFGWL